MLLMLLAIYVYNNSIWPNRRLWVKLVIESIDPMDFTPEMLDAIEAVKGKRKEGLWDHRCQQYFEQMKTPATCPPKKPEKKAVNKESTS